MSTKHKPGVGSSGSTDLSQHHYVVIMAGGIGSRFWPMSRSNFPKQFLDILNIGKTLIQSTYERFAGIYSR